MRVVRDDPLLIARRSARSGFFFATITNALSPNSFIQPLIGRGFQSATGELDVTLAQAFGSFPGWSTKFTLKGGLQCHSR
jgi:hypothetical protein